MVTLLSSYLNGTGLFGRMLFGGFGLLTVGGVILLAVHGVPLLFALVVSLAPVILVLTIFLKLAKSSSKFRTRSTFRPLP